LQILLEGLKDEVHIAARICDAIGFLAAGYQILPGEPAGLLAGSRRLPVSRSAGCG
jgi:hypothetical protein